MKMRKAICIYTILLPFLTCLAQAQQDDLLRCGTTQAQEKYLNEHPEDAGQIKDAAQRLENFTKEFAQNPADRNRQVFTIPVVFHILHDNGSEKISKAQVLDAMRILNEDFNKLNPDIGDVVSAFQGIASDCQIQFKLAEKDSNGNCHPGIEWIETPETYVGDDGSKISQWPRNKYMNVYTVRTISISNAAGYTYVPSTVNTQPGKDAIIVLHNYLGSIGTSNPQRSRTLTHEVGHWLNLFHTWGQSNNPGIQANCSDDDNVNDTPNTIGWQSCNLSGTSCSSLDNVQNYMDYSYCTCMYTQGQATRMQAALNSSIAQRDEIWTSSNLIATGTDGNDILCAADFSSNTQSICAGDTIRFYDESYHGVINWTWTLDGAWLNSFTQQNPLTHYWTPGRYDVKLVAGNGTQTTSTTKTEYISVLPNPGTFPPYFENFESDQVFSTDWFIENPDNSNTWMHTTEAAYSGNKSVKLKNFGNAAGALDHLLSTSVDLSPLTSATVTFWYAFAQRTAANNDKLTFYVSTDCGQTWMPRWSQSGSTLATVSATSSNWAPSSGSDWKQISVGILLSQLTEGFRFKFTLECDGGNNLFIDDINIDGNWDPVPLLISPYDGEINVADAVTLDWKAVNGVDEYEYELDNVISFNSIDLQTGTLAYISNNPDNSDTKFDASGLTWGQTYYWRVRSVTGGNPSAWAGPWHFTVSSNGVGMGDLKANLSDFKVYPNPAYKDVTIAFNLKKRAEVILRISDVLGRDVLLPVSAVMNAGTKKFNIEREQLPKGMYMITLTVDGKTNAAKLIWK